MHKAPQISTGINHERNVANQSSATMKAPNTFKVNFANFDAANFEDKQGKFKALKTKIIGGIIGPPPPWNHPVIPNFPTIPLAPMIMLYMVLTSKLCFR